MTQFLSFFCFFFVFVTNVLIQPCQLALPLNPEDFKHNDLSSFTNTLSSIIGKSQDAINRFRCPKGWQRFGGSCYYLTNVTSTAYEAKQICNLTYLNNSQLMRIRHPAEFFYATHIFVTHDLSSLLVQIDEHLLKKKLFLNKLSESDEKRWQSAENNFRQVRHNYYNRKKKFCQPRHEGNLYDENQINHIICTQTDSQSTLTTPSSISNSVTINKDDHLKKDEINPVIVDNESKQLDDIRKVCDQFAWNVDESDANVFLLTRYITSDRIICSISNIDPDMSYQHMCQYVLDFCFGNDMCGIHGRCINNLVAFRCSCYFYMDGPICNGVSWKFIQLCIGASIIIIIFIILKCKRLQEYQKDLLKKLGDRLKTLPCASDCRRDNGSTSGDNVQQTSTSENQTQGNKDLRFLFVFGLTFIILCLLYIIPIVYHSTSLQLNNIDRSKLNLPVDDAIRSIKQCERKSILKIDNLIFIIISGASCLVLYFLMCLTSCQCESCLSPIELFGTTNRYETAALSGIVMIEVLTALEHLLIDISELWTQGVLKQFLDRALVPLLYSIRYYPILVSLQQKNRFVSFLAVIYIVGIITYIIVSNCSCSDFISLSKSFSISDQAKHLLKPDGWAIIYGPIKNTPQFILLSYIAAELIIRLTYDLIYLPWMKKRRTFSEAPVTPTDGFTMHCSRHSPQELPNNNSSSRHWLRKVINQICQRDKSFQYTTMTMCAYTVAFSLLYYLTCVFAFQPITETSSMSFLIFCLEKILNIEIDEWSFHKEIVFSALFTMLIFGIKLFQGMKNYEKHTEDLKKNNYADILPESQLEKDSKAPISVGYLGVVFLNIVGGFFIWFHIILFIVTICSLFLFHAFTFQIYRLELIFSLIAFVGPVLVLYGLKSCITRWLCIFTTSHRSENEHNMLNKNVYAILVFLTIIFSCHVAIFSSIFRLTKGILLNVLLMPRFDCSFYGRKWEKSDSEYMAYVSYLHMEKTYRQSIQPESITVEIESATQEPIAATIDQVITTEVKTHEDTADTASLPEEEPDEEGTYESAEAETADDSDDASSVAPSLYQRDGIIDIPRETTLPTSHNLQYGPTTSQQHLVDSSTPRRPGEQSLAFQMKPYQRDFERKPKDGSNFPEQQRLMPSMPRDCDEKEEDDIPPPLPPKTYKKMTTKPRNY